MKLKIYRRGRLSRLLWKAEQCRTGDGPVSFTANRELFLFWIEIISAIIGKKGELQVPDAKSPDSDVQNVLTHTPESNMQ